jgi:hypothetical protein
MPVPRSKKPAGELRGRVRPDEWQKLPAEGCKRKVPAWPAGKPSADQSAMWRRLWALPVAVYWHDQRIDPHVVAGYVTGWLSNPLHATVGRLASELGLTPAGMQRLRLVVVEPEPVEADRPSPYAHLEVEE